jgi:hypothetical protein
MSAPALDDRFRTALIAGGFGVLFALLPHAFSSIDDQNRLTTSSNCQHGHLTSDASRS